MGGSSIPGEVEIRVYALSTLQFGSNTSPIPQWVPTVIPDGYNNPCLLYATHSCLDSCALALTTQEQLLD